MDEPRGTLLEATLRRAGRGRRRRGFVDGRPPVIAGASADALDDVRAAAGDALRDGCPSVLV
jgi:hypothetical protein